jgi:hypothetical protein
MNLKEAFEFAKSLDEKLLATDKRFDRYSVIHHRDNSMFDFNRAFLFVEDNWVFCFTERHGYFVWDKEDLISFSQFERLSNEI